MITKELNLMFFNGRFSPYPGDCFLLVINAFKCVVIISRFFPIIFFICATEHFKIIFLVFQSFRNSLSSFRVRPVYETIRSAKLRKCE